MNTEVDEDIDKESESGIMAKKDNDPEISGAYVQYFDLAMGIALNQHRTLFHPEILLDIEKCFTLPMHQKCLLTRIITRKNSWLKTSSFKNYIYKGSSQNLKDAIRGLHESNILESIEVLSSNSDEQTLETQLRSALSTLKAEEIASIGNIMNMKNLQKMNKDEKLSKILAYAKSQGSHQTTFS